MSLKNYVHNKAKRHANEYKDLGEAIVESAEFDFKAGVKLGLKTAMYLLGTKEAGRFLALGETGGNIHWASPHKAIEYLENKIEELK